MSKPKILVCGHSTCGKSALIQTMCYEKDLFEKFEIANERHEEDYGPKSYDTEAALFLDNVGIQSGEHYGEYAVKMKKAYLQEMPVDCVWYCIDGTKGMIEEGDIQILKEYEDKAIIVITRTDMMNIQMYEFLMRKINQNFPNNNTVFVSSRKGTGLNKLYQYSGDIISRDRDFLNCYVDYDPEKFQKIWENSIYQEWWHDAENNSIERVIRDYAESAYGILMGEESFHYCINKNWAIDVIGLETNLPWRIGTCLGETMEVHDPVSMQFSQGLIDIDEKEDPAKQASKIAAQIYALGKAFKHYFCNLEQQFCEDKMREVYAAAFEKAQGIDWQESYYRGR